MPQLFQAEAARKMVRTKDAIELSFLRGRAPEEYE
jgi:hypothetical protein